MLKFNMNLFIGILIFALFFVFLLWVANELTKPPKFTVKENNVGVEGIVFSLFTFIVIFIINSQYKQSRQKGTSETVIKFLPWIVVILLVVGFSLLIYDAVTGNLGIIGSSFWIRIFPF